MAQDIRAGEWFENKEERLKFIFLAIAFFFVVGGYTAAKELKDSVFMSIVGRTYVPIAKIMTMIVLIPAIFLYSYLVDRLRRYHLLMLYSGFFGVMALIFTYLLGHPTIGLSNTDANPNRIFGWLFYFIFEAYSPFVVSVFWAFANSVSSPEGAKKNYGYIVSASKIGGMISAGLAWYLFSTNADCVSGCLQDVWMHQVVLGLSACMIMVVPIVIYLLMKNVPGQYLHGYEAVYQSEKDKQSAAEQEKIVGAMATMKHFLKSIFSGVILFFKYPYAMGIFGMVYFYEVVSTVLNYIRLAIAQEQSSNLSQVSAFLFKMIFFMHFVGFLFSFFGTSMLLKRLGERTCLLLVPLLSGGLLLYLMVDLSPFAVMVTWIALKAVNYAFAWPVRESLYIPTIKEIKFKTKSWIDAFGSKFGKSSGSTFNMAAAWVGESMMMPTYSFFFAGMVGLWFAVALALGIRFDRAVTNNEVIGEDA